ncbi:ras-GEF domain-containing family member 1B-like isoform X1 [Anopheles albimanus]|uniref:Uncharacterized protein n=1 Tax=Anopheles albimanus TaxID=7167 RepID=A0A182FIY0_ANOAL|nr:ras-GEF domain-containing family member 1B-like isoform X1 [Anopheles albimanus]
MSATVDEDEDGAGAQGQNVLQKISGLLNGASTSHSCAPGTIVIEDISQTRTVHEEEILLINGIPLQLPSEQDEQSANNDGSDAVTIRNALRAGEIPSIVVLNRIIEKLHQKNPVGGIVLAVETSLTVSNCRKTTEKCVVKPISLGKVEVATPWESTEERVEKQLYSSKTVEISEGFNTDADSSRKKHYWASGSVDSGQWTETDIQESKQNVESNLAKTDDLLLHYTEGNLMSGSLDGLLTHFTPSGTYFPDKSFMFTFLLAARQFLRPDEILDKVILSTQSNGGATNVPRLLAAWMHDFPYDFRDERMMRIVRSFTEQSTENDRKCQRERNTLSRALRRLANRLTKLEKYELDKTLLQQLKFNGDEWRNAQPLVELASGSPVLMANTLTTIEAERFSFIALEEFFPAPYSSTSCRMGVSNLLAYVQWYNRLTYVVATDILRSPRKRHRARAVEFWIETGRECFNRGNFNSLMAIIATLTGGPIGRLKKTWSKVTSSSSSLLSGMTSSSMISAAGGMGGNSSSCSSAAGGGRQQLAILEHQADPTNNFATYRATLQAAAWRSIPSSSRSSSTSSSQSSKNHSSCSSDDAHSKKESTIAVLPFFSLLLKDLHFLNETSGNSILPNGHINYDKWRQLGERLLEIRRWQRRSSYQRRCRLGRRHKSVTAEVALLRESIERGPIIGDKETNSLEATKHIREQVDSTTCVDDSERGAAALAKVSYEREAPEGAVEKAHWKSLQQYST